jgi:tRNA (guanosine-2'-O-)-methyltransferase
MSYSSDIQTETGKVNYLNVLEKLEDFVTDVRKEKIERVINGRTKSVGVLCERICDSGNVAAVIRSMENLGFYDLNIVSSEKMKYSSRITNGADKWVEKRVFENTTDAIKTLKSEGYQIVGTSLTADAVPMTEVDFSKKSIICLGNEKDGISKELTKAADVNCIIPTSGFSQSFNISVAAAILLSYIKLQREQKLGSHGDLTKWEQDIMRAHFYMKSMKNPGKYFQ